MTTQIFYDEFNKHSKAQWRGKQSTFDSMNELGEYLRAYRLKNEIKMEDIENASFINSSSISRVERGLTANPSLSMMQDIFSAIGYKVKVVLEEM